MTASGGMESHITRDQAVTPGEVRTLRFAIEDENGDPVTDFTGWQCTFYIVADLFTANGLTELAATNLVTIANAAITKAAPNIDVPMVATTLAPAGVAIKAGTYWYELWRSDASTRRLAYGKFEVIN